MLALFDDLLVYNQSWEDHLSDLDEILGIMEERSSYEKESKCEFCMEEIMHLVNVISV